MYELKVDGKKGECSLKAEGFRIALLAEIPIGFGKVLHMALADTPDSFKDKVIKNIFEMTLKSMKEEEGRE